MDMEILELVKKDNVKFIQLQFTDILGVVKSLTIPASKLADSLQDGTWFDGSSIEGFMRIQESDQFLKPDIDTYAVIPWLKSDEGNTARFICDVHTPDGEPFEGDPRYILKKVLQEAKEMGFEMNTGPELEFFLFKKENSKLEPLPHDTGGYFDLTSDEAISIRHEMHVALSGFGIDVEALHHEVAEGQHEIDFRYADALKTADNAITLRFVLKAIAQRHGLHATFMPKPIAGINGSGMHTHQSLFEIATGKNAFFDESNQYKLSKVALGYIAGVLQHVKGMCAVLSPTVNSYKRLVPGYEAPVYLSWARINRSALIRIPRYSKGKVQATRCELRCPDPTCNPYLAFALMLKAGLEGIKNNLTPPDPVEEDVYHFSDKDLQEKKIETLPSTLAEALTEMRKDPLIKEALGEHTYQKYLDAKQAEWDDFRLSVSQWELDSYLEIY
ncbi:type I glutamate--ammonia ligase [candidate division KSB3 bacterium]|uniref:Glutamine synthetase n=1 Tax=candidate division KSB3 bacterium TaxID=2044937 RepID=A0A9D5Q780_9BACT|nr:type I glutamate--ammonia ligase [candidate division KSB3 bacterium]MBD3325591.1 type I glutamate--ammonia ligase [candidate division KSB3 bacterium]